MMVKKKTTIAIVLVILVSVISFSGFVVVLDALLDLSGSPPASKIINHSCTDIDSIPSSAIIQAKNTLHIAYQHTSHGSQIISGMDNLDAFMGGTGLYDWNDGPLAGALDIDDLFASGDLGAPDYTTWESLTRTYLEHGHSDVNVIIWSWCGQVSTATEENIDTYLSLMTGLENDYTNITFVYMTGHLPATGYDTTPGCNTHLRNQQIRDYCAANDK